MSSHSRVQQVTVIFLSMGINRQTFVEPSFSPHFAQHKIQADARADGHNPVTATPHHNRNRRRSEVVIMISR
jgi:hypothetical protein